MTQFHETGYGRKFLERDFPNMVIQLTRIADAMDISNNKALERKTEESLKESFNNLKIKLDEWFGNLDGKSLGKITGYNPDDYPASLTRDDAVDLGWDVWHNFSVEEKIDWKEIIESKQDGL